MVKQASSPGFSLVELSIVLVILGLLVGGVLSGQTLIRAAELRTVTTDAQNHLSAIHTFRDKYFALPGDFRKAEDFWGTDPDGCPDNANFTPRKETCNGDGNGLVGGSGAGPEQFRAWQHLANAGLITGQYPGVSPTSAEYLPISNYPSRFDPAATWRFIPSESSSAYVEQGQYVLLSSTGVATGFLVPEEMWNIDTKMDDGKPGLGIIRNRMATTNCDTGLTTNTWEQNKNGDYILTEPSKACRILFVKF